MSRKGNLITNTVYGLYRSTDYGRTWMKLDFDGHPGTSVRLNVGTLLLGSAEGIYRSIDEGATWKQPDNQPSFWQVSYLVTDPGATIKCTL